MQATAFDACSLSTHPDQIVAAYAQAYLDAMEASDEAAMATAARLLASRLTQIGDDVDAARWAE